MDNFIESDKYRAQISDMNREIMCLKETIRQKQAIDKHNPFDNPTEYAEYNENYAKILPEIEQEGFEIPFEPEYSERRRLRRFYSTGGWCMLFHFILTTGVSMLLVYGILFILKLLNPDINELILRKYMTGSSIIATINMISYLVFNLVIAFIGMKKARIKPISIIKTRDFGFGNAVQYCMAALFIWIVSVYIAIILNNIFEKYGYVTTFDQSNVGKTLLGAIIMNIYTCIIAPITEEILFRGMLLKTFSKASQRFAIFATSLFFGLAHGNIPQFMLAFLLGIFLANITMKHTSIIPAIIVHIFINTFSTVLGYVQNSSEFIQQLSIILLLAASVLGLIMFLFFFGENRMPRTTPKQSVRGLEIASTSIPVFLAFTVHMIYMVYALISNSR